MAKFQPDGWHTVTPRIITQDPEGLIRFLREVFHAQGEFRSAVPSEIRIGDSLIMVSSGAGQRDPMPAFLYVYVDDTDSTYRRAIASGAIPLEEPAEMPYGDRRAMVRDAWGNTWQIATHKHEGSP
jgi:uncharacterized glyoxalase superfamily protein PhnB